MFKAILERLGYMPREEAHAIAQGAYEQGIGEVVEAWDLDAYQGTTMGFTAPLRGEA